VDWRWELVKSNWSTGPQERDQGRAYVDEIAKRRRDAILPLLWEFYDQLQCNLRTDLDFPSMALAYEVKTSRPHAQIYLDGMVLNGVPANEISMQCGIAPSVIQAYEAMFFDVRPYLHHESWVCELAFAGDMIARLNQRDIVLISRRVAWLMGCGVFHGLYGGGRSCPELMKRSELHVHELTRKTALLRSMTRGRMDEELDISLVQEIVAANRAASSGELAGAAGFDAKHANAVVSMLGAVTLSVADPSLPATIQQPARDPRTSDVVRDVIENRKARVAAPITAEVIS
jgi:hypothetical protein